MARNQQQQQRTEDRGQETGDSGQETAPPAAGVDVAPAATVVVPSIGLDDSGSDGPAAVAPPAVTTRQGDQGRPYCPRHNVLMRADSSKERTTYYKCPVPGCEQTDKRARPTTKIPAEPMRCPQRACLAASGHAGDPEHAQYMEVDPKPGRSTAFQLRMVCPKCGFELKVPRPGVQAAVARTRREGADDLSIR